MRLPITVFIFLSLTSCGIKHDLKKCAKDNLYTPVAMLPSLHTKRFSAYDNLKNTELLKAYFPNTCDENNIDLIDTSKIYLYNHPSTTYYMAKYSQCKKIYFLIVGPNYFSIDNIMYEFDNVPPPAIGYACFSISSNLNYTESSLSRIWHQLFVLPLLPKTKFPNPKLSWKLAGKSLYEIKTLDELHSVREYIDSWKTERHPHLEYFKLVFYPKWKNAQIILSDDRGKIGKIQATTNDSLHTVWFYRDQPYCFISKTEKLE